MTARLFVRVWRAVLYLSALSSLATAIVATIHSNAVVVCVALAFATLSIGSMVMHEIDLEGGE